MSGGPTPDERIHAAYAALGAGRPADTLAALDGLVLADRPGAQGRIHAFRAQALDLLGRLPEAEREAANAVRCAKRADDPDGLVATRALHQRLLASLAALQVADKARAADAPLADTPDERLVADAASPSAAAAVLVRKANALVDAGRRDEALAVIRLAVDHARRAADPREEVFARLCEARALPADAARAIEAAHAVADAADDPNLITAVARAAKAAGVRLAPPAF